MFTYPPEKFASLYGSPLGQSIWKFLTRPETVARLATASELGRPAVEDIEEQLLDEFREDVLADRTKQMIGHMVRQIMQQSGWVIDRSEVRVQSVPFIKAMRYTRPNWSTFMLSATSETLAISPLPTGAKTQYSRTARAGFTT